MALQSDLQNISYTMAARGLLGWESVKVRQMTAFTKANELSRGRLSVVATAALMTLSMASLPGKHLMRVVGPFQLPSRWYTSHCPLLAQGHLIRPERDSVKVSVLSCS